MNFRSFLLPAAVLPVVLVMSCHNAPSGYPAYDSALKEEAASVTDSVAGNALALDDPSRKIIRTADISCRVKDVYTATASLEQLVRSVGGQVMESKLENQRSETRIQPYTSDSVKQVQEYTTLSHVMMRIPVSKLDTVLQAVAASADFIESRSLKLDDVTFQYLGNKLLDQEPRDLTADALKRSRKTAEVLSVSAYVDERRAGAVGRSVENMSIDDQVRYATLTAELSQPARIDALVIPDTEKLMQPALGQRLKAALQTSVAMLQGLLVFVVGIWPLLLIVGIVWFLVRYYLRRSPSWQKPLPGK